MTQRIVRTFEYAWTVQTLGLAPREDYPAEFEDLDDALEDAKRRLQSMPPERPFPVPVKIFRVERQVEVRAE